MTLSLTAKSAKKNRREREVFLLTSQGPLRFSLAYFAVNLLRLNSDMKKCLNISELPTFTDVQINSDVIIFSLSDGRMIAIPLAWSKLLSAASTSQRNNFIISAYNVFWDDIDEIIGVENVLFGKELYL